MLLNCIYTSYTTVIKHHMIFYQGYFNPFNNLTKISIFYISKLNTLIYYDTFQCKNGFISM